MNEAEQDHIECRQSLSYNWIHRNYHMKQKSFCWEQVQSCYDVSYILYEPCTEERKKQKKIEMFSVSVRVNNWAQSHSHMLLSISENSYKEASLHLRAQRLVLTLIKIDDLTSSLNSLCIVIPHTVINLF
jgi:hypothetical protein